MIRRIAFVVILAVAGCGSSSSPGGGSGGSGGTGGGGSGGSGSGGNGSGADLAMASIADMAQPPGFCGGVACTGGQTCCIMNGTPTCSSSCPDGGLTASCQKPSDCTGAAQACCIMVNNYMPQSVMCTAGSQCIPALTAQGGGTDRACTVDADCTNNGASATQLPDCCTSTASGQHVCFSKAILGVVPQLNQQFTCP